MHSSPAMPKENPFYAAAVDLGSNTFRLLIGRKEDRTFHVLVNRLEPVGIGRGLQQTGFIGDEGMKRGFAALNTFREELSRWPVVCRRACGTEALRRARNSETLLGKARELLNCGIEIIHGHEEASLSLCGARSGMLLEKNTPLFLADVGGGSSEFIFSMDGITPSFVTSIPLGVIGITERYPCNGSLPVELPDMTTRIGSAIAKAIAGFPVITASCKVIASGGSATALAALDLGLIHYNGCRVQGHWLSRERLGDLYGKLASLSVAERSQLPGMDRGRGEILPAGARIYEILLQTLNSSAMMVSDAGLLEGILLSQFPGENLILIKEIDS